MSELKRLYSKRMILLIAVLMILNAGFYLFSCRTDSADIITADEIAEYTEIYSDYSKKVIENSRMMVRTDVFGKGFTEDNIIKTAIHYYKNSREVSYDKDIRGIQNFIKFRLTDCFILIFLFVISMSMMAERKKGLVFMIRSTARGRLGLYINRVLILIFSALIITFLLYSANYAVTLLRYGSADLSADISSFPEFMHSPYHMTAGEYIIRMLGIRTAVLFTVSLLFFIMISISGAGIAYAVSLLAFAAEYLAYEKIAPVSSFNLFRYLNFYTAVKFESYFSEVMFTEISGHAVSPLEAIAAVTAVTAFMAFAAGMIIHGKGYAKTSSTSGKIAEKISAAAEKLAFQHTMAGWEMYKLFIKQKGILYVAAALILSVSAASSSIYGYKADYRESQWYKKYDGQVTESVMEKADKDKAGLESKISFLEERLEKLKKNPRNTDSKKQNIFIYTQEQKVLKKVYYAFNEVYSDLSAVYEYTVNTGNDADLIKPYTYEILLTHDAGTRDTASLYILLAIIGSISGIFAYDTQNNMRNSVRSLYRGRLKNTLSRLIPVCIVCALMCVSVHMVQFIQITDAYGLENLDSPVHSLPFIGENIPDISIKQYLVLLFVLRAFWGAVIGLICCAVSRFAPDTVSAAAISVFILVVPSLVAEFVSGPKFFSAVYLLGGGI